MNWGQLVLVVPFTTDVNVYTIIVILNGIGAGIDVTGTDANRRTNLGTYVGTQPAANAIANPQGDEIRNVLGIPAPTPTVIPIPAAPTIANPLVTRGSVEFSWNDVAGTLEYHVYGRPENATYVHLGTVPAGQHLFVDTQVQPGHTYRYYVVAVGATGNSPSSNIVTGTPPIPPVLPQRQQQRPNNQGSGFRDFWNRFNV